MQLMPAMLTPPQIAVAGITRVNATSNTGASANWTVNTPAGNVGDLIVITVGGQSGGWTPPSGFTKLFQARAGGNGKWLSVYWKFATSSEPASYTDSSGADTSGWGVTCVRYSGVNTTTPFLATPVASSSTTSVTGPSSQAVTNAGITTTRAGSLLMFAAGIDSTTTAKQEVSAFSTPSGYVNPTALIPANKGSLFTCEQLQSTQGASGGLSTTATIPNGGVTQGWNAYVFAMNPP